MPSITSLNLKNFRNLTKIDIDFSPQFNLFYGNNGAGKTSLLEAIYFLALGKSFRTSSLNRMIQSNTNELSIFTMLHNGQQQLPIGVQRSSNGDRQIKYNGEPIHSLAPLAKEIPLQLISTFGYRFFHDGPKIRRQFLDWLLFHVEPTFFPLWQRLQRVLKQRNSALKAKLSYKDVSAWNQEFIEVSDAINEQRSAAIALLEPILTERIKQLLPSFNICIHYHPGWEKNKSLSALIENSYARDRQLGYTSIGPQRADFQLKCNNTPAQDLLSQGQQKLAIYALQLAQGMLVKEKTAKKTIYLIDDMPSELDASKREAVTQTLQDLGSQVFITGIELKDLEPLFELTPLRVFHVEHGQACVKKKHSAGSIEARSMV